ncbi:hypothetical protein A1F94_003797 [Pyrenophora tritici-repentis]|uniref:Uncharacterized protein n=1 Tax=Pyrenophora tritici-repentis TaxID=45151 RepID=A0A5M9LF62_9PLEO|nr:hypothetical protein PtrV1_05019 [Pyrenophora tritici-repentis]KAF7452692.1 hypothetical protein A1F99_044700 [Pyrenophora tritici-repentis]KAF7574126.1 hypothetical protein PtrM4_057490 [Pyrenophora tritici-repentis]KAG9387047.1 hypothetical protein A1F94_003797 [Pyrenophora tritici-repentis]KAI0571408.1 hypothetical protein Alg215_10422 [Pyrenophora tritici-repentis]
MPTISKKASASDQWVGEYAELWRKQIAAQPKKTSSEDMKQDGYQE